MLKVGDYIECTKALAGFDFVGEKFKVTDIKEDGAVVFESDMGRGVMSHEEFEKHFATTVCDGKKEKKDKFVHAKRAVYDLWFEEDEVVEYAENGKDVRVKIWLPSNVKAYSNDPGYRVGHASCAPADVFDIDIGAQIAYARAMKKVWKAIDEYCTNNPHWVEE